MNTITHHTTCPLCAAPDIRPALTAKDHTVSGESFDIWECSDCTARFTQNTPEPDSIGAYYRSDNYISHSNTNRGLVNKLYHRVRKITLAQKRKLIQQVTKIQTGNLLDVGAGTGLFVDTMRKGGWKVTGLEPDATARTRAREMNIMLQDISDLYQLPAANFDVITLWHVLEHVHDVHGYLKQLKHILKHEGHLVIAVPNYTSADARLYRQFWAAYDVPRHLYHFSPASMQALLRLHGFQLEAIYPQWFDSFYVSLLSEQYRTGHSNFIKGIWNGFRSNLNAVRSKKQCSSLIYVAKT
ncbi:MAG TPA: class I SAM-dependent methyltransferase [Chitinophagaceae bacterium]|nr:class I SAM-dependent methyltransferase [Chitinophagaceae bacterium]